MASDKSKSRRKRRQIRFANSYVMANSNYFNPSQIYLIKEKLKRMPVGNQMSVQAVRLKHPLIALILSLFFGFWGIDRLYVGDYGLGILKFFTFGGFGFWTFIDWFIIMKAAKKANYQKIMIIL